MSKGKDLEKAYGLIIGISKYKDPGIRRLNYAHADAEGIFKLLTDPKNLGLSKDNIKILLDKDATLFNIKDAISNWLFKNADKDSVVFIFFAGHGGVEEDPRGIEKDKFCEKCGTALIKEKVISYKKLVAIAFMVGVFLLGFWLIAPILSDKKAFNNAIGMEFVLIPAGEYAWYYDNSNNKTHPVGQKKPNLWGLYDWADEKYQYLGIFSL